MEKPHVTCQWHGTGRAGKQQGEKPREVDISCHTNLQEVLKIQLCNSTFIKLTYDQTVQWPFQGNKQGSGVIPGARGYSSRFKFWISAVQLPVGVVLTSGTNTSPGVFGQSVLWVLQGHWVSLWAPPGIRDTIPEQTPSRIKRQTHVSLFTSKTQHQFNPRLPSMVHSSAAIKMLN